MNSRVSRPARVSVDEMACEKATQLTLPTMPRSAIWDTPAHATPCTAMKPTPSHAKPWRRRVETITMSVPTAATYQVA
jgi:hypothetical protein